MCVYIGDLQSAKFWHLMVCWKNDRHVHFGNFALQATKLRCSVFGRGCHYVYPLPRIVASSGIEMLGVQVGPSGDSPGGACKRTLGKGVAACWVHEYYGPISDYSSISLQRDKFAQHGIFIRELSLQQKQRFDSDAAYPPNKKTQKNSRKLMALIYICSCTYLCTQCTHMRLLMKI